MRQIKSESLLFPQHAAPEIVIELRGNEQGRFAALHADLSCGDGIALEFEPITSPNVDLRNDDNAASFWLNGKQDVVDPAFASMTGSKCDQFEGRRGTLNQRVHDGSIGRFDPLPKNFIVLKTREREFDDRAKVLHAGGERFCVSISQVTRLANDGLFGIVWKTDRRLLVAWGVAKIYFRVGRIRGGCWCGEVRESPVDARC